MDKENDFFDEDSKSTTDVDTIENIEEHYAKMYKDLPPEVVKMLINTHPLYGSKSEYAKEKEKLTQFIRDELEETKILREKVKTLESKLESTKNMGKLVESSEFLAMKKKKECEDSFSKKDIPIEESTKEEDEEVLYSLFHKEEEPEKSGLVKYIATFILTSTLLVCIIGMIVNIIQNKEYETTFVELNKKNEEFERTLNNLNVENKFNLEQNEILKKENEGLKNQLNELKASQEITTTPNIVPSGNDNKENNSTSSSTEIETTTQPITQVQSTTKTQSKPQPQTYTVAKGETLWSISKKFYGDGNYYKDIMRVNNLKKEEVEEGMKLILPDVK